MLNQIISKFFFLLCLGLNACSYTTYVMRHAEKDLSVQNDPLLTPAGQARSDSLKEFLKSKKIKVVLSTDTKRTISTASPTAAYFGLNVEKYDAKKDLILSENLKTARKNSLIIGHSNTVKHIVNRMADAEYLKKDLLETEYNYLFIIKRSAFAKPKASTIYLLKN
jgi:phosphohistidine phosphatase SixA